jgi:hypothetical protein
MRKPFAGEFRLSQGFGENPDMYAKYGYKGHNGMDWACPTGTPILAPHSGKIIEASLDADGYGNYIKIENDKEGSVLGHNKTLLVKVGDSVTEGQEIAISNNTGYSTGAHIHWGYYTLPRDRQNGYGGFINQSNLINGDMYKGYDLSNADSMKIAIDCLVDLQNGLLIRKEQVDQIINESQAQAVAQAQQYEQEKAIKDEHIKALEESLQKLQDTEHTWADQADMYQRKLKAVVEEFAKVGVSIAVESDALAMANTIPDYLATYTKLVSDNDLLGVRLLDTQETVAKLEKVIVDLKKKETAFKVVKLGNLIIKFYKK